ncbi:WS/DGAT/MGAT family acyltransferase [Microbacterium endophyticum]|uniref:diacylglycerol O-acyltransferase n=1 Tax=Microbacterium endophyticum TaxID=1526412 RepID=A0A7W4YP98_9MICO|nr:wax ester/triacylglycerol synthase domain-containing protein [Microbacterium endophyticum]MBB2976942.1 WS/DGAT/MGAT family acyltransferase [Microbacterium endophyticum]NIK35740.1 WS/DGAT/MGAT family acyltransferase [Microbacterium endophyticum]
MVSEPDPLSVDDARILSMESDVLTGHTLKLIVIEPGVPLDLDAVRAAVAARLVHQPRALQRVEAGEGPPRWVPSEGFDIVNHVRRRTGAEGATTEELWHAVGVLMSEHLDRAHPLWTLDLLGPLADGREAIAARMHHAMVDGIAGMRFLEAVLLDAVLLDVAGASMHAAGRRDGEQPISRAEELRRMPAAVLRELGRPGPASPFDRPVTSARELAFVAVPLKELKAIGASRPERATVNDVLLTVVAGGLSRWLGSHAAHSLRAQVPVSLHHRDEASTDLGNRDSFLNVDLPLTESDPLRRLDRISAQTRNEKLHDDPTLMYDLFHALGRWNWVTTAAHRIADSSREFSVAISNVPGPRARVSIAGRHVEDIFTSSEPATGHALRISAISCAGEMGIGFCVDPKALPRVAALADATSAAYRELRAAAQQSD